jgi:hypothetical protein
MNIREYNAFSNVEAVMPMTLITKSAYFMLVTPSLF